MKFDFLLFGLFHSAYLECKDKAYARTLVKPIWRPFMWIREVSVAESNKRFVRRYNKWEPVALKNIALDAEKIVKHHAKGANAVATAAAARAQEPTRPRRVYVNSTGSVLSLDTDMPQAANGENGGSVDMPEEQEQRKEEDSP